DASVYCAPGRACRTAVPMPRPMTAIRSGDFVRRSAAPVLLMLLASGICLVALEALSRVLVPMYSTTHPRGFYVADAQAAYRPAPNQRTRILYGGRAIHVRANRLGVRGPGYGPRVPGVS